MREAVSLFDIVVVNDGSSDATAAIAEQAGAFVISLPYDLGIGAAIQTGYIFADEIDYDIAMRKIGVANVT